jgi:phytoene dehydrogenase-like protein
MMNPRYVESHLRAHRDRLLEEAAADRLLKEAHAGRPAARDLLAARAGDLLLTCGLWLKRRTASAGALVPDVTPQTARVITYRLSERFWQQMLGPRPTFGLHLLRYDGTPTIGVMYWRLDRSGSWVAPGGDYAAITWLAAAPDPSRPI